MFYVILEEEGLLGPSMGTEKFMNLGPRKGGGGSGCALQNHWYCDTV